MSSISNSPKLEKDIPKNMENIVNAYLENLYGLDENDNLEMEVRFGTRNINKITKISQNNVIQVLLGHGFELLTKENYLLRIQNEYIDTKTSKNKISNIRTEITGLTNIQNYCKNNHINDLLRSNNIKFTQKNYFKKADMIYTPINYDEFNFRLSLQLEKNLLENSEIPQDIIRNWK